ncbi:unnamed protein product [Rangifer tarandus platyrhynchus]|uniref:Uncharacterized protein n=1 Tax=Rangifer tarandus platyrhynchus TaxID=3082113 RepID=A0AC59YNT2_RANTA
MRGRAPPPATPARPLADAGPNDSLVGKMSGRGRRGRASRWDRARSKTRELFSSTRTEEYQGKEGTETQQDPVVPSKRQVSYRVPGDSHQMWLS